MKIPLFPTVNSVVFPNSSSVYMIKREFSINAVKESQAKYGSQIVITSQKDMATERPGPDQVYRTACLCEVTNVIELPDRSMKFAATAKVRFRIDDIIDADSVFYAIGETLIDTFESTPKLLARKEVIVERLKRLNLQLEEEDKSLLTHLFDAAKERDFVWSICQLLRHEQIQHRSLSLDEINRGVSILDALTVDEKKKVNSGMARMQEILESSDLVKSLQLIENILGI